MNTKKSPDTHPRIRAKKGLFHWAVEQALGAKDKSSAGRKPYPPLFMFKILIFQSLYNLSDEDAEREQLKDLLARRFVGLSGRQFGPDATTI